MKGTIVISPQYKSFAEKLSNLGYNTVFSQSVDCFIPYERFHADMQCLASPETVFVLSYCTELAEKLKVHGYNITLCTDELNGKYPYNVGLNALVLGNSLIAKLSATDSAVLSYYKKRDYRLINVNQGYTRCSCLVVDDNSLITADDSIYNSLSELNYDVLRINQGSILLDGEEKGFIGGASGRLLDNTIVFFGDLTHHPDANRIEHFCNSKGVNIKCLGNGILTDIGGITLLIN